MNFFEKITIFDLEGLREKGEPFGQKIFQKIFFWKKSYLASKTSKNAFLSHFDFSNFFEKILIFDLEGLWAKGGHFGQNISNFFEKFSIFDLEGLWA